MTVLLILLLVLVLDSDRGRDPTELASFTQILSEKRQ